MSAYRIIKQKGIKAKSHSNEHMAQGIATIALFGECWWRKCTHVYWHEGKVKGGKVCPVCEGRLTVEMGTREKLSIGKLEMLGYMAMLVCLAMLRYLIMLGYMVMLGKNHHYTSI